MALRAPAYDYAYGRGYGWHNGAPYAYGPAYYGPGYSHDGPGYAYAPGHANGPVPYDKVYRTKHVVYDPHHARACHGEPSHSSKGGAPMANRAGQLPGERTQCRTGCD